MTGWKAQTMPARLLALFAWLMLAPTAALAAPERLDKPLTGVVAILDKTGRVRCSGFTFGGNIVVTAATCIFEQGARTPRTDLSIVAGMHSAGRLDGADPKPFSRHYISRVHVPRDLGRLIRSEGFSFNRISEAGLWDQSIVALRVLTPGGTRDFDDTTQSIGPVYAESLHSAGLPRVGSFAQYGYDNTGLEYAQTRDRCDAIDGTKRYEFAARCRLDDGSTGGPLIDESLNRVVGVRTGFFPGDGRSSFTGFRVAWENDLIDMLDGYDSGLSAFETFDVNSGYFMSIDIWNKCRDQIRVAIHYKDADTDNWVSDGFHVLEPGEFTILPAITRNVNFYWAAGRTRTGQFEWSGNDTRVGVGGREVSMRIQTGVMDAWRDHRIQPGCD